MATIRVTTTVEITDSLGQHIGTVTNTATAPPVDNPRYYAVNELLNICKDASVPQPKWGNRDSASAQMQLGKAYALLAAGCDYFITEVTDDTIWIVVEYQGFSWFEYGDEYGRGPLDHERFYLPTRKRLTDAAGRDWC